MTFFKRKEDVIDFQLTSEGRRQLALGEFKPAYYEFYDNGIIYDLAYLSPTASISEAQNASETRIKSETIYIKPNSRFTGSSNQSTTQFNDDAKESHLNNEPSQYLSSNPHFSALGTFDATQQKAPYYKLRILNKKSGSLTAPTNQQVVANAPAQIPQLDITCSYRYWYNTETNLGYRLDDPLVLSVEEKNTIYKNFIHNFEVQVFEMTGSVRKQPKKFILSDKSSPKSIEERSDEAIKILELYNTETNLVFDQLEVLLDEIYTNEYGFKFNLNSGLFTGKGSSEIGNVGDQGGIGELGGLGGAGGSGRGGGGGSGRGGGGDAGAAVIGFGGSGRNAGSISSGPGASQPPHIRFGEDADARPGLPQQNDDTKDCE